MYVCMYVINIYLVSAPLRAFPGALMNCSKWMSLSTPAKQMRLDQFFWAVTVRTYCGAYRCGQFIPGTWSSNRKSPSLHRCRPTAWNYQAELFSRSQATTSMHCRDENTEFLQIWRCSVADGVRNEQQCLEFRPLCCWQPVKIVSNQTRNWMDGLACRFQFVSKACMLHSGTCAKAAWLTFSFWRNKGLGKIFSISCYLIRWQYF